MKHHRSAATFCLLAFVPFAGGAASEYAVEAGESVSHVQNPFLFPDGTASPLNRSDTVKSTDVGAAVRIPLPSDRSALAIGARASKKEYDALKQLDHTEKQLDAIYTWEFQRLLSGSVRHRTDDRLYNYYGGTFTNLEVPHNSQDTVQMALRITPELSVPVTYTRSSLRYQDPALAERYNLDDRGLQLALTYTSPTRSTISVGVRQTDVRFPQRNAADVAAIDSGYTDRETFVEASYQMSDRTVLVGRIGKLDRTFASLASRNTSLVSTEFGADYQYSPKTALHVRGFHRPQSNDQADQRLYVISTGIELRADWQATPKTRFNVGTAFSTQQYQNFLTAAGGPTTGSDRYRRFTFGMDYFATPRLALRLQGIRERYEPDAANALIAGGGTGFGRNLVQLGASYSFENLPGTNRAQQQLERMRTDSIR